MNPLFVTRLLHPWCIILSIASLILVYPSDGLCEQEVKIGVIVPLTGQFSYMGDEVNRVIKVIEPMLRDSDPELRPRFLFEDGRCGIGNSATTAAKKLINVDKVKFLITGCSGETLQAGPLAQMRRVVTFAVISNHTDVKNLGDYVFRTYVDVERGMEVLVDTIRADGNLPIAILTEDNAYTQGMKKLLESILGNDVAFSDDFGPGETDFRTILLKARGHSPKSFYFNCAGPSTCASLINQSKQSGINAQVYSYVYTEHPDVLVATKQNANGIRYLTTPDVSSSSVKFQEFSRRFRQTNPGGPKMDFLVRTTFDAIWSIWAGVLEHGPNADKVKQYLYSYSAPGALGTVSFDENGDIENIDNVVKVIEEGQPGKRVVSKAQSESNS